MAQLANFIKICTLAQLAISDLKTSKQPFFINSYHNILNCAYWVICAFCAFLRICALLRIFAQKGPFLVKSLQKAFLAKIIIIAHLRILRKMPKPTFRPFSHNKSVFFHHFHQFMPNMAYLRICALCAFLRILCKMAKTHL